MEFQETSYLSLKHFHLILKRRWLPASVVFLIVFTVTMLMAFLRTPIYQAQGKLRIKDTSTSSITGLDVEIGGIDSVGETNPLQNEIETILSGPIVQQAIDKFDLKDKDGIRLNPALLREALNVSQVKGADMLDVSFQHPEPEYAADVVNSIMSTYLEHNILDNRSQALAARQFIEKQLPQAEAAVRQVESSLRQFKEEHNLINLTLRIRICCKVHHQTPGTNHQCPNPNHQYPDSGSIVS